MWAPLTYEKYIYDFAAQSREPTGKDTVESAFRSEKQCQHIKFGASRFDTLFSISETCRLSDLKADFTVTFPVGPLA